MSRVHHQPERVPTGNTDMRGKAHSDETRAAVMAALLAGQGVTEVAEAHNLDPSVVSRWRKVIPVEQMQEVANKKARDFGDLLGDYLEANLRALKAQAEIASESDYIRKQPAAELATLHGVMADKSFRLIEAVQRAQSARPLTYGDIVGN